MANLGVSALVLVAAVGAGAGALGGYFAGGRGAPSAGGGVVEKEHARAGDAEDAEPDEPRAPSPKEGASESTRIAALERRVALLTAALARGDASLAKDQPEVDGALKEVDVADPVFEAAVLDIMDRESERKDGERETRRADLVAQHGKRLSSELTETLGLAAEQQAEIARVVTEHFEKFRALRSDEAPDRPITRRDWQKRTEELNQVAQSELQKILTPAQFEQYQKLDPDDQIGFGWGRGREGAERRANPPRP
jgi:hypothetical protein